MANYYRDKNDFYNMIKHYLLAIEKGDKISMFNLGTYYKNKKKFELMEHYYSMSNYKSDELLCKKEK